MVCYSVIIDILKYFLLNKDMRKKINDFFVILVYEGKTFKF